MKKYVLISLMFTLLVFVPVYGEQDCYRENYNKQQWDELERKAMKESVSFEDKNGVLYIKIVEFRKNTYNEFYDILKENSASKIIIDVRNNKGGFIKPAIEMAALFVKKDKPFLTVIYEDKNEEVYLGNGKFADTKVVVLVNTVTASAAEAFALSLNENGFSTVGETTYGKNSIQRLIKNEAGGEKYTVGNFFVNDRDIQTTGMEPKYTVINSIDFVYDIFTNGYIKVETDNQLNKAISLLKGGVK